jgi:hypothetical protein
VTKEKVRFPPLHKAEPAMSFEAHARALELACRAAAQILGERADGGCDDQEPLPASSLVLLKRLPRRHD